jgi:sterol desaturase/sphingolipid hydroxylase (fatty acid hydroxylase superfamily)
MSALDKLLNIPKPLETMLLSPGSMFSIYAVAFALAVAFAFLALRQKRRRGHVRLRAIARMVFARRVLFHRSTFADLGYFVFSVVLLGALLGWALISASAISDFVLGTLRDRLGAHAPLAAPDFALRAAMTLALFLGYEFGFFVDHNLKHRIPFLWELHKTHHSAEVLTPLTNFRVHPLDSLVLQNNLSIFIGLFAGVARYLIGKPVETFQFDATNILMVLYIYLTVQLQHSQIWIPFTGKLGCLFMSPAHHQMHHSSNPVHFNRNMGASLAIWDWLFGTLAMPQREPLKLKFGTSQTSDPHSVTTLLVEPIGKAVAALLGIKPSLPLGIADAVEKESGEATLRRDAPSAIGSQP